MYTYYGSDNFSLEILKGLAAFKKPQAIITQPDRPSGRSQKIKPGPLAKFALTNEIKLIQPQTLKNKESQDEIIALGTDLHIVVSFGQILPLSFIEQCPAIINGHASLLPEYRGASPIQSSLLNGDKETGMTIMHIIKALDAGNMICKGVVPIVESDNHQTLSEKLILSGIELLKPFVLGESVPEGEVQNHELATYCGKLTKDDSLLNLKKMNSDRISNIIRAFSPKPGAFLFIDSPKGNMRLKILATKISNIEIPTSSLAVQQKNIYLRGESGKTLEITKLQPEGKAAMDPSVFLNGWKQELKIVE